jgi:HEAT repeat protein
MGDFSSEKALDRLWKEDLPDWVRVRIARGLVLIRNDKEAFSYLLGKISADSLPISGEAIQALGIIGNPDAIDSIIGILRLKQKQFTHSEAIKALKLITGKDLGRRSAMWVEWYEKEWKPSHPR